MEGKLRIGLVNFAIVGIMAVLFIVVGKIITAKYPVPGLTEVFHSA